MDQNEKIQIELSNLEQTDSEEIASEPEAYDFTPDTSPLIMRDGSFWPSAGRNSDTDRNASGHISNTWAFEEVKQAEEKSARPECTTS